MVSNKNKKLQRQAEAGEKQKAEVQEQPKTKGPPKTVKKAEEFKSWRHEMREAAKRKKLDKRIEGSKQNPPKGGGEKEAAEGSKKKVAEVEEQQQQQQQEEEEEPPKKKKKKAVTEDAEGAAPEEARFADPEAFKVVVAGLPLNVDEKLLRRDFSDCGEVLNVRLLKDRETGTSRGIAFISFTDQETLDKALEYNATDYGGRSLMVQKAEKSSAKGDGKGKSDKGKGKGKGAMLSERPDGCTSVILKGLAYSVTDADLKEAFKSCGGGPTNVDILTDRDTGKSRGIGFLDFETERAVDDAIKLNGTELKGRRFNMDFVAPRAKAKEPGAKPDGCTSVLVKGLAYAVTDADLTELFKSCGDGPSNVRLVCDKDTGESRGMAFIDFESDEAVEEAIKLHGTELKGRRFIMDYAANAAPTAAEAEEKKSKKAKGPGKKPEGCTSVVLEELAEAVTEKTLMRTFKACDGGPRNVNIVMDKETGVSSGMAFVNFSSEAAVDEAMKLSGTELKGQGFTMRYVKPKPRKEK